MKQEIKSINDQETVNRSPIFQNWNHFLKNFKKYWFINELNESKRADISQNIWNQII